MNSPPENPSSPRPLNSIRKLSVLLACPLDKLHEIATRSEDYYHPFPKTKPDGSVRTIHKPIAPLKQIQTRINELFLKPLSMPPHLHGGVIGRSPKTNALPHVGKPIVITIDIKQFFPSITEKQIHNVWKYWLKYGEEVSLLLTKLTSYKNQLPQGSPASTAIANLALFNAEHDIQEEFTAKGLNLHIDFTRFVDDITISGQADPQQVIAIIIGVLRRHGYHCKRSKIKVMPSSNPQIITGLLVNKKVSLPKEKRRQIRAAVHNLAKMPPQEQVKSIASVTGKANYHRQFHKRESDQLSARLKSIKDALDECS